MLIESDDAFIDVIAGEKYVGTFAGAPQSYLMPRHAACVTKSGPRTLDLSAPVDLRDMTQPWLLLWWGERTNFRRTTIPNIYSRLDAWSEYVSSGDLYVKADMPMLLVFERKPLRIAPRKRCPARDVSRQGRCAVRHASLRLPPFEIDRNVEMDERFPEIAGAILWCLGKTPAVLSDSLP